MIDIGNWLRQARYRAKKNNVDSKLTKPEVIQVLDNFGNNCAYCPQHATSLDNPIPFSDGAPNVQANVLPICAECKALKRNRTICWMHENRHIDQDTYVVIVAKMMECDGSELVKSAMRRFLGM